jgi:hypothetical protein
MIAEGSFFVKLLLQHFMLSNRFFVLRAKIGQFFLFAIEFGKED